MSLDSQREMKMSFPLVGNRSGKKDCGQAAMTDKKQRGIEMHFRSKK